MNIWTLVDLTCPYCNHEQSVQHPMFVNELGHARMEYTPRIATCDQEGGGCDRYYAYRVTGYKESTEVFKMVEHQPE